MGTVVAILGAISAGFGVVKSWLGLKAGASDAAGGQAEQKAVDQGEALTVSHAVAKAQAGPSGDAVTEEAASAGKF